MRRKRLGEPGRCDGRGGTSSGESPSVDSGRGGSSAAGGANANDGGRRDAGSGTVSLIDASTDVDADVSRKTSDAALREAAADALAAEPAFVCSVASDGGSAVPFETRSWSVPVPRASGTAGPWGFYSPSVAALANQLVVAWSSFDGSLYHVWVKRHDSAGRSPAQQIDPPTPHGSPSTGPPMPATPAMPPNPRFSFRHSEISTLPGWSASGRSRLRRRWSGSADGRARRVGALRARAHAGSS